MKLIFTTHTFEPFKDGVQAVNKYLTEGLANKDNDVTVVTQTHKEAPEKEVINGVKIIRMPIFSIHTVYKGNKREYQKMILKLTEDADALINVAADTPWTDWCSQILGKIRCKKILYLHGMYDFRWHKFDLKTISSIGHKVWNETRWFFHYLLLKKTVTKYDAITQLHYDDDASKFYRKHYGVTGTVIENAAEKEFFDAIDTNIKLETPERYCIFVGNYIARKNQEYALKALYTSKTDLSLGMVFIGSEETKYYHKLEQLNAKLSKRYGNRDVRFLTHVDRAKVREYVKRAEMCVVGSTWEAYPVAVVECMASSIPFISTDVGCVKFLPGGVVVNSFYEMSRWIELIDKNPKCAKSLGCAGRAYAMEHQTVEVCVNQLLKSILN